MLPPDLDGVTASYHRCMSSDHFLDTFYELFLAKSFEVSQKFRNTDFQRQKRMLRESLLMLLLFNRDPQAVEEDMVQLAERHSRRGVDVPAHLYSMWLDSLCEAVQQHDPEYSSDIGDKWRAAMQPGIDFMVQRH